MTKRDRKNICVLIPKRLINKSKIKVDFTVISRNVAASITGKLSNFVDDLWLCPSSAQIFYVSR
jgi:hypothetical protein